MKMATTLQPETMKAINSIPFGTVSQVSQNIGILKGEPIILILDGLLRYAKAYEKRYEEKISSDNMAGPAWFSAIQGIRTFLDFDGAVALEMDRTTDSKDNGVCEGIYHAAIKAAGFEDKLN